MSTKLCIKKESLHLKSCHDMIKQHLQQWWPSWLSFLWLYISLSCILTSCDPSNHMFLNWPMPRAHICLLKISQKNDHPVSLRSEYKKNNILQTYTFHVFPLFVGGTSETSYRPSICKCSNKCYSLQAFWPWQAYGMLLEKKRGCSRAVIMAFCKVFFSTSPKHNFNTTSANMANSTHSISTSQSYNKTISTSFWFFPNHGFHPQEEPILSTWADSNATSCSVPIAPVDGQTSK